MKDRTWLIRTKKNKILGPLSKQKVIDLVQTESLTGEDEICSGNGYWFWVKEKDLVDKYLLGDAEQSFNPVCEAETLFDGAPPVTPQVQEQSAPISEVKIDLSGLDSVGHHVNSVEDNSEVDSEDDIEESTPDEEVLFPEEDDLSYPDMDAIIEATTIDPDTVIKPKTSAPLSIKSDTNISFELDELDEDDEDSESEIQPEQVILPQQDDLEYPELVAVEEEPAAKQEDIKAQTAPQAVEQNIVNESTQDIKAILQAEIQSLKEELEVPELPTEEEDTEAQPKQVREMPKSESSGTPVKKKRRRKKKKKQAPPPAPKRNDRVIVYLLGLVVAVIFYGVFYYYTEVLGKSLFSKALNIVIPTANAQEVIEPVKKKFN